MIEDRRLKLHEELCQILGSKQVYYQAPVNVKMSYPAIVYELVSISYLYADCRKYLKNPRFKITLITKDPISPVLEKLNEADGYSSPSFYVGDGLNHYIFYKTL